MNTRPLLLTAAACTLAWPVAAMACGNVSYPTSDEILRRVVRADRALQGGHPAVAGSAVLQQFSNSFGTDAERQARFRVAEYRWGFAFGFPRGDKRNRDPKAREQARRDHWAKLEKKKRRIVSRARTVLALSVLRTGGKVGWRNKPYSHKGKWTREMRLRWAVAELAPKGSAGVKDARRQAWRAEALAHTAGGQAEAARILSALHRKGVLSTPEGYAALAKLSRGANARTAMKRCRALAARKTQCRFRGPILAPKAAGKRVARR